MVSRSLAIVCALVAGVVATPGGTGVTGDQKVTVTMADYKFRLRPTSVSTGPVLFTAVNKGISTHDFKVLGKRSPKVRPGKKGTVRVTFTRPGRYRYVCTLPRHDELGMKGVLVVR